MIPFARSLRTFASCALLLALGGAPSAWAESTRPGVVETCSSALQHAFRDVKDAIGRLFARPAPQAANVAVIEDDGTLLEPGV